MAAGQGGHDVELLDLLSDLAGQPFDDTVWRVVREGRAVEDGSRGAGRWNPHDLEVLYGALEADGAIAEIHFHLSRGQSVFPSRLRHRLYELEVVTGNTLMLADLNQLMALGVEPTRYKELLYERTQEIGAAAAFLGFDGLISPSARWDCNNIVLFLDHYDVNALNVIGVADISWPDWISRTKSRQ